MDFFKNLQINYKTGDISNYSGRKTVQENHYWHQIITSQNIADLKEKHNTNIGLVGYVCDEGVRRNQGRIGAKKGPEYTRKQLGKLPVHFKKTITDFGNVICSNQNLEDCQNGFSKVISKLISNKILPVAIGGGHDIAFANFNGIKDALKSVENTKIGIVNFDAHFDLRKVENQPNSGTPFHQILSENDGVTYFAIGIQQQANTKELFEIAEKNEVSYISNLDCETFSSELRKQLIDFTNNLDYLYITIDLDGFSSAFAPGVSAPSSLGFTPIFVYKVLAFLMETKKVISVDIAELNPSYDIDNATSKLAAKLIDFIVSKS